MASVRLDVIQEQAAATPVAQLAQLKVCRPTIDDKNTLYAGRIGTWISS
jgi:hypothetical protein